MTEKILVPVLGESITEATVSKWLKNVGDKVVKWVEGELKHLIAAKLNQYLNSIKFIVMKSLSYCSLAHRATL